MVHVEGREAAIAFVEKVALERLQEAGEAAGSFVSHLESGLAISLDHREATNALLVGYRRGRERV